MKRTSFLIACVITITTFTANAQQTQTIDAKKGKALAKALHECKILGRISYPKSAGIINNFIDFVKSNTSIFKVVNGTTQSQPAIPFSKMTITEVTKANSANYEFDFVIDGSFPFDMPLDVYIKFWCYHPHGSCDYINFPKKSPSEIATLSLNDRVYEGFDFQCTIDLNIPQ